MPSPALCRKVIYVIESGKSRGEQRPAEIVRVNPAVEDTDPKKAKPASVNLVVTLDGPADDGVVGRAKGEDCTVHRPEVVEGEGPGTYSWPPTSV